MSIAAALVEELKNEAATTRRLLERVPEKKFDWKPHEKSFSLAELASHLANLVIWSVPTLEQDEFDLPADYQPWKADSPTDLLSHFDGNIDQTLKVLENYPDEKMTQNWTMRSGDLTFFTLPRIVVMRSFILNHLVHHRGQLSVYLRLNDIPVPAIYGPSADEQSPGMED